jgi:hypothetical protein
LNHLAVAGLVAGLVGIGDRRHAGNAAHKI